MARTVPKYRLIADGFLRDIDAGRLEVGASLPTESEIMRAFGVSRFTVRNALRVLRALGVVASRQGQGTRVVSRRTRSAFVEKVQSIDELVAFALDTRRVLLRSRVLEADARLAAKFRCAEGRRILEVTVLRTTTGETARPLALVTLWTDALFETVVPLLEKDRRAAGELLRERFGLEFGYVQQTVRAAEMDEEAARILDGRPGQPVLTIERAYCARRGQAPHLLASSVCPPDAVQLVSHFEGPQE